MDLFPLISLKYPKCLHNKYVKMLSKKTFLLTILSRSSYLLSVISHKDNGCNAFRHIVSGSMTKLGSVPELWTGGQANSDAAFSNVLNNSYTYLGRCYHNLTVFTKPISLCLVLDLFYTVS